MEGSVCSAAGQNCLKGSNLGVVDDTFCNSGKRVISLYTEYPPGNWRVYKADYIASVLIISLVVPRNWKSTILEIADTILGTNQVLTELNASVENVPSMILA
jgi:hypothetical protein